MPRLTHNKRETGRRARGRFVFGWLLLGIVACGLPAQEPKKDEPEPPIRLKRREKSPEEVKPADKAPAKESKKDEEPALEPGEDAKQILERIGKNLRAAEERLKARDASDATQQVQRDIIKDLDKLIEHQKNQDQQQQQQQDQQAGAGGGGSGKAGSRSSRSMRSQKRAGSQQAGQSGQQQGGSQAQGKSEPKMQPGAGNQGGQAAASSAAALNRAADVHKDPWGEMPPALRQQMDAYAREGYMLKYQDLLRQYYATLAEKGRRGERERDR